MEQRKKGAKQDGGGVFMPLPSELDAEEVRIFLNRQKTRREKTNQGGGEKQRGRTVLDHTLRRRASAPTFSTKGGKEVRRPRRSTTIRGKKGKAGRRGERGGLLNFQMSQSLREKAGNPRPISAGRPEGKEKKHKKENVGGPPVAGQKDELGGKRCQKPKCSARAPIPKD